MQNLQIGDRLEVAEVIDDRWNIGYHIGSFRHVRLRKPNEYELLHDNGRYYYMTYNHEIAPNEIELVGCLVIKTIKNGK